MKFILTTIAFLSPLLLIGQTRLNTNLNVDSAYCSIINDTTSMKLLNRGVFMFVAGIESYYGHYITNKDIIFSKYNCDSTIDIPFFNVYNQVKDHLEIELNYDSIDDIQNDNGNYRYRNVDVANVLVKLDNDTILFLPSNYDSFEDFVKGKIENLLEVRLYSTNYEDCVKNEKIFREELRRILINDSVKHDWRTDVVPLVYTPECSLQIATKTYRGIKYIMHDELTELCERYCRLYNMHKIILFSLRSRNKI